MRLFLAFSFSFLFLYFFLYFFYIFFLYFFYIFFLFFLNIYIFFISPLPSFHIVGPIYTPSFPWKEINATSYRVHFVGVRKAIRFVLRGIILYHMHLLYLLRKMVKINTTGFCDNFKPILQGPDGPPQLILGGTIFLPRRMCVF